MSTMTFVFLFYKYSGYQSLLIGLDVTTVKVAHELHYIISILSERITSFLKSPFSFFISSPWRVYAQKALGLSFS